MKLLLSPEIVTREQFAGLCVQRHLLVSAVEVGTLRAGFALPFLNEWPGKFFTCIDPWEPFWEAPGDRTLDYTWAVMRLAPHADRVLIVRQKSSPEVADGVAKTRAGIEFVYIDGDHRYEQVREDIASFWDRLSPIGILAGHDFTPELPGVVQAVTELAEREDATVYLTHDLAYKSWYVYKNPDTVPLARYESMEFLP